MKKEKLVLCGVLLAFAIVVSIAIHKGIRYLGDRISNQPSALVTEPTPATPLIDSRSYDAGYKAGYNTAELVGDERIKMHHRCDAEIVENHYDKKSFDEGFAYGREAALTTIGHER